MREIKFRAWDKTTMPARMKTWEQLSAQYQLTQVFTAGKEFFELMQYTGLKDKNGKEIYEGDYLIVSGYNYDEPEGDWEGEVSMGEMEIGIFGICCDTGDKGFFPLREIGGEYRSIYEVMGNVYENPELLKECEIDD